MARISTHVLDTARGVPAQGVAVELHALAGDERRHVHTASRNGDGRTEEALVSAPRIGAGVYELTFRVGEYFRRSGSPGSDPPFLDVVVIRFGVADPAGHYHVPLLVSPYGYTTYRGS